MRNRLALSIGLLIWVQFAFAEQDSFDESLIAIQTGIASVKQKIESILKQKEMLSGQLAEIESRYGESAATLKMLQDEIVHSRQQMDLIRQDIFLQKEELTLHRNALASQLNAEFVMSRAGKLKLLLNRQDLAAANRMVVYQGYLRRQRLKKLLIVQKSVAGLAELESRQRTEALQMERDAAKMKLEQSALTKLRTERNQFLAAIEKDYVSGERQLGRLRESEDALMLLIENRKESNDRYLKPLADVELFPDNKEESASSVQKGAGEMDFEKLKGRLPWPVISNSTARSIRNLWDGILIEVPEGTQIRAVTSGRVIYAQWLSGYGLLLILDHGNGYMSLYGFNQSLYKRVNDWVEVGEVIAGAGQSGGRSQSGLYFSIRKNGKPVDPSPWLS